MTEPARTTPSSWQGLITDNHECTGCMYCARLRYSAPITPEQREAMLEGAPSWMPGEPKRGTP
jgi:hypothetical protein